MGSVNHPSVCMFMNVCMYGCVHVRVGVCMRENSVCWFHVLKPAGCSHAQLEPSPGIDQTREPDTA